MKKEKAKKEVLNKGKLKKNTKVKKHSKVIEFLLEVKKELGKVRWPNRKEMITYSLATVAFVIFFSLFFSLSDIILSGIKMLVK